MIPIGTTDLRPVADLGIIYKRIVVLCYSEIIFKKTTPEEGRCFFPRPGVKIV